MVEVERLGIDEMNETHEISKQIIAELRERVLSSDANQQTSKSSLEIYLTTELGAERKLNPFPELHRKILASSRYRLLSSALQILRITSDAETFLERLDNFSEPHQLTWNMLIMEFSLEKMDQIAIEYIKTLQKFHDITREPKIPFGEANQDWMRCRNLYREGDSFYFWDASADEWVKTYRTNGYCLVRRNKILDFFEIGGTVLR